MDAFVVEVNFKLSLESCGAGMMAMGGMACHSPGGVSQRDRAESWVCLGIAE